MIFEIDGFNIVPYIGENGIKWQANGVDGPEAGRTMDARMHRGLVAIKAKCDVSCLWMDRKKAHDLMQALFPETVVVRTDTCPWIDGVTTFEMYSNNIGATCLTEYTDGKKLYGDVTFPLVEV